MLRRVTKFLDISPGTPGPPRAIYQYSPSTTGNSSLQSLTNTVPHRIAKRIERWIIDPKNSNLM
jgi:hypothetical protein